MKSDPTKCCIWFHEVSLCKRHVGSLKLQVATGFIEKVACVNRALVPDGFLRSLFQHLAPLLRYSYASARIGCVIIAPNYSLSSILFRWLISNLALSSRWEHLSSGPKYHADYRDSVREWSIPRCLLQSDWLSRKSVKIFCVSLIVMACFP